MSTTGAGSARIAVQADEVAALGSALTVVASDLAWCAATAGEADWALGRGQSAAALTEVLGDFEHARQVLGRALDELGAAARHAGALYVGVEQDVGGLFGEGGGA